MYPPKLVGYAHYLNNYFNYTNNFNSFFSLIFLFSQRKTSSINIQFVHVITHEEIHGRYWECYEGIK
jgi:hypothetical protein